MLTMNEDQPNITTSRQSLTESYRAAIQDVVDNAILTDIETRIIAGVTLPVSSREPSSLNQLYSDYTVSNGTYGARVPYFPSNIFGYPDGALQRPYSSSEKITQTLSCDTMGNGKKVELDL